MSEKHVLDACGDFKEVIAGIEKVIGATLVDPVTRQFIGRSEIVEVLVEQMRWMVAASPKDWSALQRKSRLSYDQTLQAHQMFTKAIPTLMSNAWVASKKTRLARDGGMSK